MDAILIAEPENALAHNQFPKPNDALLDRAGRWLNFREYDNALHKGEFTKALQDFEEEIRLTPMLANGYNSKAWVLDTCADDKVRNGKAAVEERPRLASSANRKAPSISTPSHPHMPSAAILKRPSSTKNKPVCSLLLPSTRTTMLGWRSIELGKPIATSHG